MANNLLLRELRQAAPLISVGVLTADLLSLGSQLELMERAGVKLLHIDVMDGCFCPMMTVGPPLVKAMKTTLLKDVHLMIDEPLEKIDWFVAAGADLITVHAEFNSHPHRVLQKLGSMRNSSDPDRTILRGLAINPGTPLEVVRPLLDEVEMVFLLAINPGWGGQGFIDSTSDRLTSLREMIDESGRDILIGVDGGVKRDNIGRIVRMGTDIIVTGSAVFDGKTPLENAQCMLQAVREAADPSSAATQD